MREAVMVEKMQEGDASGLEALMDRYIPYVSTVVWNILRGAMPAEDGEEVVSDVFLAAWKQAGDLAPGHLKGWLGAQGLFSLLSQLPQVSRGVRSGSDWGLSWLLFTPGKMRSRLQKLRQMHPETRHGAFPPPVFWLPQRPQTAGSSLDNTAFP